MGVKNVIGTSSRTINLKVIYPILIAETIHILYNVILIDKIITFYIYIINTPDNIISDAGIKLLCRFIIYIYMLYAGML